MSSFSTTLTSAATYIAADPSFPRQIVNVAGGVVYHKNASDVDSGDTELAKLGTVQITEGKYFISATKSEIVVRELKVVNVEDLTTVGDVTVGDDLTVAGLATIAETLVVSGKLTAKVELEVKKALKVIEVSTLEGAITAGSTLKVAGKLTAEVELEVEKALKVVEAATLESTLAVTGVTTPTGGVASAKGSLPGVYAGGWTPIAATSGTDTAFAEKKLFVTSLWLPANKTITGIGILVGSVGGTDKAIVGLFDSAGKVLAESATAEEGTVVGTKETMQEFAFGEAYAAVGPGLYFIGITANGGTAKLRTIIPNVAGKNIFAAELELAEKNVLAEIAAPSTFTGSKGPIGFIY